MAAGLSGQNMNVNPFDLHEFLTLGDKMIVISWLLGASVAFCGTSDPRVSPIIYIPNLNYNYYRSTR